jgi:hypothetical protein
MERDRRTIKKQTQLLKTLDSEKKEEGVYWTVSEFPYLRVL